MAWETDFLGARFDVSGMSRNARRYALEPPRCGHSNGAGHMRAHSCIMASEVTDQGCQYREGCLAVEKSAEVPRSFGHCAPINTARL